MPYAFSGFILDTEQRLLTVSNRPVQLTRQSYELLCYLVANPQRVITRDELIEHVWKGRIVADNTVDQSISKLRKSLNSAREGQYIEALYGEGFRFTPKGELTSAAGRTNRGRWFIIGVLVLFLAVAALSVTIWSDSRSIDAPPRPTQSAPSLTQPYAKDPRPAVAILPLRNHSEGAASFASGVHEEVLSQLSRIGTLRVISRTSVMRYADTSATMPAIASELGVDAIVEGSVQQAGDQIRIHVNLIEASSDSSLWAHTFDRQLSAENLFAMQSEISKAIAATLDAKLTARDEARLARRPTNNLNAYQSFLLGRHNFDLRLNGEQGMLERAEKHYLQALELEPKYAEAMAGLAMVYAVYRDYSQSPLPQPAREMAIEYAQSALELEPSLGEPHAVLGLLSPDVTRGQFHLLRAIELEPNNSAALLWAGELDLATGFLERAETRFLAARDVEPTSPSATQWLAIAAYLRGDHAAAIEYAEQGRAMGFIPARGMLSIIHFWNGRGEKAAELLQTTAPAAERDAWLGLVTRAEPNGNPSPEMVNVVLGPDQGASIPHFRILYMFAIGAIDEGYELIEKRLPHGISAFVYVWHAQHPELRAHPAFARLADQLGLPQYWAATELPKMCQTVPSSGFRCY